MDTTHKLAWCVLVVAAAGGLGGCRPDTPPAHPGDSALVQGAFPGDVSRAREGASLRHPHPWVVYDSSGWVRAAVGVRLTLPRGWSGNRAQAVRRAIGAFLPLGDEDGLDRVFDVTGEEGVRHVRFQQVRAGRPVRNAFLTVHMRGDRIVGWNSSLVFIRSLREGALSPGDAVATCCSTMPITGVVSSPVWWVDGEGNGELAYEVVVARSGDINVGDGPGRLVVSRVDGRVLERESLVRFDEGAYPVCGDDSELDCRVETVGTGDDGVTYPLDLFRGQGFPLPYLLDGYLHPYEEDDYPDLMGDAAEDDIFFVDLSEEDRVGPMYVIASDGSVFSSYDRQFFDSGDHITYGPGPTFDAPEYGASVSALVAVRNTLEYYWEEHGRQGIDDAAVPMDVVVRAGLSGYNASWISDYNLMCIGTSRGTSVAVAQDIIGHELTHGVIDFSANLTYSGQSGALNEALADLFGTFVEAWVTRELNWTIGEDIPGRPPVRSLAHPERFGMPGHMSGYIGEDDGYTPLHYDSAIVNKAMYLAVVGTPPGRTFHGYAVTPIDDDPWIGIELLGRCAYDTLVYRLTSDSGFTEFALSMLGAALECDVSPDLSQRLYSSLLEAFLATGILTDVEGNPIAFVSGRVVSGGDDAEAPIAGAEVRLQLGDQAFDTSTDTAGNFLFELGDTNVSSALVTVTAVGYYDLTVVVPIAFSGEGAVAEETAGVVELALDERPTPSLAWRLDPPSLALAPGGTGTVTLSLWNEGASESQLSFSVHPTVSYTWKEVPYEWEDLTDFALPVHLSGDQGHSDALFLNSGFPFYLQSFDRLYLSTDGYVTLTEDGTEAFREWPIPSEDAPANLVAPFWADLDFGSLDRAYYYYDGSRAVAYVQYQDVPAYGTPGVTYTFQVVLLPDGRIRLYYKDIPEAPESWARVGIQDGLGLEGLEVAVLKPGDELVIPRSESGIEIAPSIVPSQERLTFLGQDSELQGVVSGGMSQSLSWAVSGEGLVAGDYALKFRVETSDPTTPSVYVPLPVHVE